MSKARRHPGRKRRIAAALAVGGVISAAFHAVALLWPRTLGSPSRFQRFGTEGACTYYDHLLSDIAACHWFVISYWDIAGLYLPGDAESLAVEGNLMADNAAPPPAWSWRVEHWMYEPTKVSKATAIGAAGWPLRCCFGQYRIVSSGQTSGWRSTRSRKVEFGELIAVEPVPAACNVVVAALAVGLGMTGIEKGIGMLRARGGGCARCGYNKRGLSAGSVCPECGT